jgi:branched-chain amino acid transport system substrate-binding protein
MGRPQELLMSSSRTRFGPSRLVVALAAVVLLAAGCSSGGDSAEATSVPNDSDAKVVTIGVIAPLDNGLTDFGRGIASSVQLAVDEANERNAIPGYRIAVEALDDSSDPAVGEQAATTLAADPSVIGVVGTYNSGVAAVAAPVLAGADIVMVSPANTDPTLTVGTDRSNPQRVNDNYFRVVSTDADQGPLLASYAAGDLSAVTVAVVTEAKSVSSGLANDFVAAFTADGGTVTSFETLPDDRASYNLPLAAAGAVASNPDLIFFGGEYEVAAQFTTAAASAGYAGPVMGGDGMKDDRFITVAGAASDGSLASSVGVPNSELDAPDYFAAYEAAGFTADPTDYGPYAFDAANLIIAAAAEALADGNGDVVSARTGVRDLVQVAEYAGITGTVAFDEFGDTTTRVFTIFQVADGAWKPVVTRQITD